MVYRTQLSSLHSLFLSLFERRKKNRFLAFLPLLTRCLNTHSETHVPFLLFFFLLVDQRSLSSRATRFSPLAYVEKERKLKRRYYVRTAAVVRAPRLYGSLDLSYYFTFIAFKQIPRDRYRKKIFFARRALSSEWIVPVEKFFTRQ